MQLWHVVARDYAHFSASLGSTIAGWISAAILNGLSPDERDSEITLEPQQN